MFRKLLRIGALTLVALWSATIAFAQAPSGAIFTSGAPVNGACTGVNLNHYLYKTDVFLNGGPSHDSAAGLTDGDYYVQVTSPQGTLLGTSVGSANPTPVHVANGEFSAGCLNLYAMVVKADSTVGYADTDNDGNEYKVWVSTSESFTNSDTKTDNFKVYEPHLAVAAHCSTRKWLGDTMHFEVVVTNSGRSVLHSVTFTYTLDGTTSAPLPVPEQTIGDITGFFPGASYTYGVDYTPAAAGAVSFSADAAGLFTGGDFVDISVSASDTCGTVAEKLDVSKTANTELTRTYSWTINKSVTPSNLSGLKHGDSATASYTVAVGSSSSDSNWKVTGVITVSNNTVLDANIASITDSLPGTVIDCGAFGGVLAAHTSVACTYVASRSSATGGTNTASATLTNGTSFDGTKDYDFASATVVKANANASVADAITCPTALGFSCTPDSAYGNGNWSFTGGTGGTISYAISVANVSASCETYGSVANTATLTAGGTQSSSATVTVDSGACPTTCTLTIGYWKTHAGGVGNNPDNVTARLPILLGNAGGSKTVTVTSASQAITLLAMSADASNGVNKLYAQLLGAKLNISRGASPAVVQSTITAADNFLASKNANDWAGLSKTAKTQVNGWASTLDAFNNGAIAGGPVHCQ